MKPNTKILIVEDSKTQALELRHILEKNAYIVQHANDAEEAIVLLKQNIPDVIISDIVMPGMNGYKFCAVVKSDDRLIKTPVILLTSLSDTEDIIKGLECGADSFITKPYNEDFLISKLEYIIINSRIRKEQLTDFGLEILFAGKKHLITSSRLQIIDLLLATYESAVLKNKELINTNKELKVTQIKLKKLNENLDIKVKERTKRIENINAILRAIRSINQLIIKEKDRKTLIKEACNIIVQSKAFQNAWIAITDENHIIIDSAEEGLEKERPKKIEKKFFTEYNSYCYKKTLKFDGLVLIKDIEAHCMGCPNSELLKQNQLGVMAMRLRSNGNNYGMMNVALPIDLIDDKEEQLLFKEVAEDIAFALYNIDMEDQRKQAEEELKKHKENLEELVTERTNELNDNIKELERLNKLFVGREFRIKELRDKVTELEERLSNNKSLVYNE